MDPLSATATAITFVVAIEQAGKCLKKLNALRHAAPELKSLREEVGDLTDLLHHVKPVSPSGTLDGNNTEEPTGLDLQITQISGKLENLKSLLDEFAPRPTRLGFDRHNLGWYKGRQRANKLREDLKVLRLNLNTSLGTVTVDKVERVEVAIEKVSSGQEELRKVVTALVNVFCSTVPLASPTFDVTPDGVDCSFNVPAKDIVKADSSFDSELPPTFIKMTRHQKRPLSTLTKPALNVYARKPTGFCQAWCSCSCHKKSVIRLKQPLQSDKGGSFTFCYSGLPWLTAECDEKRTCSSRSSPSISTTIHFPAWFWRHYISTSLTFSSLNGPNLNIKMPRTVDWTPTLWKYAEQGNITAIQGLFASQTASPFDISPVGGSALHFAAGNKHLELCRFLISQGALADHEDDFKNSGISLLWDKFLSKDLTDDDMDIVTSAFSDNDYLQSRQFSVLHKIVLGLLSKDLQEELQCSTKGIDAVDANGRTCVSWAASRGDEAKLKILLEYGANPRIPDIRSAAPIHQVRNPACCELLIQYGADVFARNSFGHTSLISATRSKDCVPLLEMLVGAGVDVNAKDYSDETALCNGFVALEKLTETARFLIDNGADVNAATDVKDTIVHFAVQHDAHDTLRLLLDRGVDYTPQTMYGQTILHKAARMSDSETIGILEQHGISEIDVAALDHLGKSAMDYVDERDTDTLDPDFRERFEALHRSVLESQITRLVPQISALDVDAGLSKSASVMCLTPLTSEDEELCDAGDVLVDEGIFDFDLEHDPVVVFFDAPERLDPLMDAHQIAV